MKNVGKKKTTKTWIERIAAHPVIIIAGLASLAVAVVALIVMIVFFFASQTERDLVYAVNPIKTTVVKMGQASGLEVRHNGGELGDVDITAAQVAVWNSGDDSIRKENILREVVIYTDPPVKILEVSIVKYSREFEITYFSVLESRELMDKGRVPISWNILERDDGASIQLIYLGSPEISIYVDGLIEGSGEIKKVGRELKIKTPIEQVRSEQRAAWFLIGFGVLVLVLVIFMAREALKDWREDRKLAIFEIVVLVVMVGSFSVGVWYTVGAGPLGPPFGF